MSRVWINSPRLAEVTDGRIYLNYVETSAINNDVAGLVSQHPGEKAYWTLKSGETGMTATIEEAKRMVEKRLKE